MAAAIGALANAGAQAQGNPARAYEVRGRAVEGHRQAMQDRLQRLRSILLDTLRKSAPDLVERLDPAPPPVPQGYQLLPRLLPDHPMATDTARRAALYSWPWTDTLIMRALQRVDEVQRSLTRTSGSRRDYERLVGDFNGIAADRRLIDAHVEHNWFWQRAIAADTDRFSTASRMIESALRGVGTPEFALPAIPRVRMALEDSGPGALAIRIPVVTDIEDTAFVRAAQSAIERLWSGVSNGREFQIHLDLRFIPPNELYCPVAAANCTAPARGAVIDLGRHVSRFPADLAVLTTGGTQPHVLAGRSMVLGPRDLSARTLAHEFGHILGFDDAYLRGYRSLGSDGYAIIELVPDGSDIMAASGGGATHPRHLVQLVANLRADRAMKSGLDAMYERRNPRAASELFREALANRVDHYGATFQLAKALDQGGDSSLALPVWRRVLSLARASGDSTTAAMARARIGAP